MLARKYSAVTVCTVLVLAISIPQSIRAAGGPGDERPIRLYATAWAGQIGILSANPFNVASVRVNGRCSLGEQPVWSGDLLQAQSEARVMVESVGEVRLSRGTTARLAVTRDRVGDDGNGRVLIASLATGQLDIELLKDAAAYLETPDSAFTVSAGAAFHASIREGRGVVDARSGSVSLEKPTRQDRALSIAPVGNGNKLTVITGHSITVKVQVLEDQKPVADVPIVFAIDAGGLGVGTLGIGTLSGDALSSPTDASGVALIPFAAGAKPGKAKISATIQGTRVSWIGEIEVKGPTWTRKNTGILFGILAAGAVGGGIAIAKAGGRKSIQIQPPQVQNP